MAMQAIQYPTEILSALGKEAEEFEEKARLLLALKYYETGKLSTGLAAQLAGVSRSTLYTFSVSTTCHPLGKHLRNSKNLS